MTLAARPSPGPKILACGPVRSRVYVLGERAGRMEHDQGRPFVGDAGQTLRKWFDDAELELEKSRRWNVCIDYQEGNRHPQRWEIERDRSAVVADIARCQPDVIVAVGAHAMRWCLGNPNLTLDKKHGKKVDVEIGGHKAVCVPIYHPSRLQRGDRAKKGKADVLAVAQVLRGLAEQ